VKLEIFFLIVIFFLGTIGTQESNAEILLDFSTNKVAYQNTETIEIFIKNLDDRDAILNLWAQKISFEKNRGPIGHNVPYTNTEQEIDINSCIQPSQRNKIPSKESIIITLDFERCLYPDSVIGNWRIFSKTTENDSLGHSSSGQEITVRESKEHYSPNYSEEGVYEIITNYGKVHIPYKIDGGKLKEMTLSTFFHLKVYVDTLGGKLTVDIPREFMFLSWGNGDSLEKKEMNFNSVKGENQIVIGDASISITSSKDSKTGFVYFSAVEPFVEKNESVNQVVLELNPFSEVIGFDVVSVIPEVRNVIPTKDSEFFQLFPPHMQKVSNQKSIICREGLELIQKSNDMASCVKPESIPKLIERGWAKNG